MTAAIKFLLDDWLCDVTATTASKCVLIAMALTSLERSVFLSGRPAFFITAAKRGGGKTTAAHMVSVAALGIHAVAAAWSPSEEERRKAMLAYLSEGVPLLTRDIIEVAEVQMDDGRKRVEGWRNPILGCDRSNPNLWGVFGAHLRGDEDAAHRHEHDYQFHREQYHAGGRSKFPMPRGAH